MGEESPRVTQRKEVWIKRCVECTKPYGRGRGIVIHAVPQCDSDC